jgi:hypothetical protein
MEPNDSKVITKGRKNALKQVEAPLREQVLSKLVSKLEDQGEGQRTIEIWNGMNNRRADWLKRQETFQTLVDEFLEPLHDKTQDWQSNLHLPTIYSACKTLHARFMAALFDIDPPFSLRARQSAYVDRAPVVSELIRYSLKDWANHNQGIEPVADFWVWDIVTSGSGTLKARWERKYTRFVDVVEEQVVSNVFSVTNPETGETESLPQYETVESEKEVTIPCFIGPAADVVSPEDIVVVGGEGDPQVADEVLQQQYLTAGELWTLADQGIFRKEVIKEIIKGGENYKGAESANAIKVLRAETAGQPDIDHKYDLDRYHIIERYARIDVDGSGIPSDVVLWVHKESAKILRATYLYRMSKTGKRPYFRAFFHRRRGDENGVGLPELMYSIAMEIDAIHNMKLDFGLISSMPFFFFRATSNLAEERIPFEPGMGMPVDDPTRDVYFPNIGAKWAFPAQEEQFLFSQIERITALSEINMGMNSGTQGALRTAQGARALIGESNANLNIYLRRINRAWKQFLTYWLEMIQEKLPPGFEFRVFGDDGQMYFQQVKSREEIAGMFDFELEGNSANSNKSVSIEQANNVLATIANPLFLQMGIVDSVNLYNAIKAKFVVEGIKDFSKFIRKPQGPLRTFTPEEVANMVLAGVDVPLDPTQDLQGIVTYWSHIKDHDELLGQFTEQQTVAMEKKAQEAMALMEAVAAQQAQVANAQQVATNANMAQANPAAAGAAQAQPAAAPQAPPTGE